ncbi:MAG: TlpA family protein disulfide reductase [Gammaproteobacteria bacterium]|nr:TlpA family protein disulfide reductase [Gammaproteobacteria bacterium]
MLNKSNLITVLLAALLAVPATINASNDAPDFALKSLAGENVRLSELRGQVVMINFWASWCGPCRQEMPHLEALHQRYESLGFTLLGINVEQERRDADRMLADMELSFPILFDNRNAVSKLYGVIAMPSTVLIDRSGQVRYVHNGYKSGYEKEYQNQVRSLIKE